jgi:hypothetical protein
MACCFAWRRGLEEEVEAKNGDPACVHADEPGEVNWKGGVHRENRLRTVS